MRSRPKSILTRALRSIEPIELQTRYTLKKLKTVLEFAGSSLQDVVHARVAMVDPENISGMERVWQKKLLAGKSPGAQHCFRKRLGIGSLLDRNFYHRARKGIQITSAKSCAPSNAPKPLFHEPQALRVGDLLFLSTQLAVDENGLDASVGLNCHLPFHGNATKRQMAVMLRNIKAICEAGGASLETVLRPKCRLPISPSSMEQEKFGKISLARAAGVFRGGLRRQFPVEGCSVLMDVVAGVIE